MSSTCANETQARCKSLSTFLDGRIRAFSLVLGIATGLIVGLISGTVFFLNQAEHQNALLAAIRDNISVLAQHSDYREIERVFSSFIRSIPGSEIYLVKDNRIDISVPNMTSTGIEYSLGTALDVGTVKLDGHGHIVSEIQLQAPISHTRLGAIVLKAPSTPIVLKSIAFSIVALLSVLAIFFVWRRKTSAIVNKSLEPMIRLHNDLIAVGKGEPPRTTPSEFNILELADISSSVQQLHKNVTQLTEVMAHAEGEKQAKEAVRSLLHDIANPFTTLSTLIQTICLRPNDPEVVTVLKKRWPPLQSQIFDLLKAGRHIEIEKPKFVFEDIAYSVFEGAQAGAIADPAVLQIDRSENNCFALRHDPALLGRAVANMVRNAIEAKATSVKVWIEGSKIHIKDNGPGIPKKDVPTLFEGRLKSLKPDGTGIGFPTALRLVKLHNGRIILDHSESVGCHFIIEFLKDDEVPNAGAIASR